MTLPRLVERLNADWYDLAVSSGLFDHRREFLVKLPQGTRTHRNVLQHMHSGSDVPSVWTRVRLLRRWDIMGRARHQRSSACTRAIRASA
ncbi:hypothetical protein [Streptomyces sp. NPDC056453]|uniref:hypothetical protein n=1 Tax=Streptomyces sp. NPDC056453 TaxID=3345822 RepID=UPI0036B69DCE